MGTSKHFQPSCACSMASPRKSANLPACMKTTQRVGNVTVYHQRGTPPMTELTFHGSGSLGLQFQGKSGRAFVSGVSNQDLQWCDHLVGMRVVAIDDVAATGPEFGGFKGVVKQ